MPRRYPPLRRFLLMPAWVDGGRRQYRASRVPPTYEDPCFFSRRGTPRRYGLREMEVIDENLFTCKEALSYSRLSPRRAIAAVSLLE